MQLNLLHVCHRPKSERSSDCGLMKTEGAFYLNTCLREIWIFHDSSFSELSQNPRSYTQYFRGAEAYLFLLRLLSGIESELKGETEILGQFKLAWEKFQSAKRFGKLIQKLLEDAKEIRSEYLQNLGSVSYGSLVRKFLQRAVKIQNHETVLLVGSGSLAGSIKPWLKDFVVKTWARSDQTEESLAWQKISHVVLCIPYDSVHDPQRVEFWKKNPGRSILHLGGLGKEAGVWNELLDFYPLDTLFELQEVQNSFRTEKLAQAHAACEEKTEWRLRYGSATRPLTLPHGWEDLPIYA